MILSIRFSFTRAHTRAERRVFREIRDKHTLEKSRQIKFLRKKKNERRKATNTTNEDE